MKNFNLQQVINWLDDNPNVKINEYLNELMNKPTRKRRLKLEKSIVWLINNIEFRKNINNKS
jgi:hypothetical protein